MEQKSVLIAGAGELGSRYLQSMSNCVVPLKIYLHDTDPRKLEVCIQRWTDAQGQRSPHQIVMCQDLAMLSDRLDMVIVSSTAQSRLMLVESIARQSEVKYWIIEKVLAQCARDIDRLHEIVQPGLGSWANYYMRAEDWYGRVKHHIVEGAPKTMIVQGGDWGLACNALHFIHLHTWFAGSRLTSLDTSGLASEWHEGKRPGNWEIFGSLRARFSDGGELNMRAERGPVGYSLTLQDGPYEWQIDESKGIARRSDGLEIVGRVHYQSERKLVEEILTIGDCQLPTLKEVVETDKCHIDSFLEHWRRHEDSAASLLPIT